jgi:Zn-dependent M28 family amino/carboxypeptidase
MFRATSASDMRLPVLALALLIQAPTGAQFSADNAWAHLRALVAIGPRPAGSPAIESSRAYIRKQLAASGISVTEQAWTDQTPRGPIRMVNLIATVPGSRSDRVIVAGHYDTKRFDEFAFVGANDGGSSAAFLLELARVLKARRNTLTYEILFLDGEEAVVEWQGTDNTYGSRHYVAEARRSGALSSIKALILVDMIADRDLEFKRDVNSTPWLTELIWNAANRAGVGRYFSDLETAINDDHLPFLGAGVPAVDIIDLEYAQWHTRGDTLDAISPRGLQVTADAILAALPELEKRP